MGDCTRTRVDRAREGMTLRDGTPVVGWIWSMRHSRSGHAVACQPRIGKLHGCSPAGGQPLAVAHPADCARPRRSPLLGVAGRRPRSASGGYRGTVHAPPLRRLRQRRTKSREESMLLLTDQRTPSQLSTSKSAIPNGLPGSSRQAVVVAHATNRSLLTTTGIGAGTSSPTRSRASSPTGA